MSIATVPLEVPVAVSRGALEESWRTRSRHQSTAVLGSAETVPDPGAAQLTTPPDASPAATDA